MLPKRRQSHQGDKLCDVSTVPLAARWPVFLARGSDADGEPHSASNHGNFVALVKFRARYDNILAEHLKNPPKNPAYMSKTIQDELIQILGNQIRSNIAKEVKHAKHYSVLADEVTNISRHEQVSLCLRFVDERDQIREEFMDFVQTERIASREL